MLIEDGFYVVLLLLFVRSEGDYVLVPLFNSIGIITTGMAGIWVAVKKMKLSIRLPGFHEMLEQFKRSSQFFLSRISVSVYSTLNTLVLGFFTTNEIVGYYAAAEKLFIAMRSSFYPLVNAMYPYMAKRKNIALFRKAFTMAVGIAVVMSGGVYIFSYEIVELVFEPGFDLSAQILRLFALIIPVVVASIMLGYPFLGALGYEKYANYSIAIASVCHLIMIALLIPVIGPVKVAMVVIVTEIIVLSIRIYGVNKHRLWTIK